MSEKYRKKPVVIEATQWDGTREKATEIIDGILVNGGSAHYICDGPGDCPGGEEDHHLVIRTLEGDMTAIAGDWIIRGVQGEFYPIKSDIFEATYERVADDERTDPVSKVRGDEAP